ncbi:hypothetical protein C9I92_08015 [Photobacterium ganghwense]|uniref:hypothetical protein n=1 Tax=Photobacterium ganghwense TaxID=320778 RepID=UPI000AD0A726|nr:hypothetical protein [Photobacterium ganghwense]PSU09474.1 hypothetical protein C9I92_08015 [Photobacterium ganghwense]QSV16717.1 hypothetical protein FH974_17235 [Photobacterium ganghwense]
MKKIWVAGSLSAALVLLSGCANEPWPKYDYALDEYKLVPDDYEYDVPYNSIYHYGYNQGCASALRAQQTGNGMVKDETLDGTNTRFNAGWDAGNLACRNGLRVIMPTSKINPDKEFSYAKRLNYAGPPPYSGASRYSSASYGTGAEYQPRDMSTYGDSTGGSYPKM